MKKTLVVMIFGLCIFASGMLTKASAAETVKIGVVDLLRALNESEAGKKAKADLEALIKSKQASIDEKGKKIEALKGDLEKQAALISADAKKTKEEELERLIREYQRVVADSQAEVQKKESELTGEILKDLRNVINTVAQEEGYSLILEKAEGLVLYISKHFDITDKITKKYDESKAARK